MARVAAGSDCFVQESAGFVREDGIWFKFREAVTVREESLGGGGVGGEDADHAGVAFGDGRSVVVGASFGFVDFVVLGCWRARSWRARATRRRSLEIC